MHILILFNLSQSASEEEAPQEDRDNRKPRRNDSDGGHADRSDERHPARDAEGGPPIHRTVLTRRNRFRHCSIAIIIYAEGGPPIHQTVLTRRDRFRHAQSL